MDDKYVKTRDGICLAKDFSEYERIISVREIISKNNNLDERLNVLEDSISDIKNLLIKMSNNG